MNSSKKANIDVTDRVVFIYILYSFSHASNLYTLVKTQQTTKEDEACKDSKIK